jgi:hypothetical protein
MVPKSDVERLIPSGINSIAMLILLVGIEYAGIRFCGRVENRNEKHMGAIMIGELVCFHGVIRSRLHIERLGGVMTMIMKFF